MKIPTLLRKAVAVTAALAVGLGAMVAAAPAATADESTTVTGAVLDMNGDPRQDAYLVLIGADEADPDDWNDWDQIGEEPDVYGNFAIDAASLVTDGYEHFFLRFFDDEFTEIEVGGIFFAPSDYIPVDLGSYYGITVYTNDLPSSIAGVVTSNGSPVPNVQVGFDNYVCGTNQDSYDPWDHLGSVYTGADGAFEFGAFEGQCYQIYLSIDGEDLHFTYDGSNHTRHYVPSGTVDAQFLVTDLPAFGSVSGKVTFAGGVASWTDAELFYWDSAAQEWYYASRAWVASDGTFSFPMVRTGRTYSIRVSSEDYYETWLGGSTEFPTTVTGVTTFTVAADQQVTGKNITLSKKFGKINLSLTGFTADEDVSVRAVNLVDGRSRSTWVYADEDGRVNAPIFGLTAGTYAIFASSDTSPTTRAGERLGTVVSSGATTNVSIAGAAAQRNFDDLYVTMTGLRRVGATVTATPRLESYPENAANGATFRYYWSDGARIISTTNSAVIPATTLGTDNPLVTVIAQKAGQASIEGTQWLGYTRSGVERGSSPFPTSVPTISGQSQIGKTLTANPGRWNPNPTSFTYQWLRAGTRIPGAVRSTYQPTAADLGKRISVQVTPVLAGFDINTITSAPTAAVGKASATVKVKLAKKKVKRGKKAKVTVTVSASGVTPAGKVTVRFGKKKVTKSLKKGKVTISSKKLKKKGKVAIKVSYAGNAAVSAATGKNLKVTVK